MAACSRARDSRSGCWPVTRRSATASPKAIAPRDLRDQPRARLARARRAGPRRRGLGDRPRRPRARPRRARRVRAPAEALARDVRNQPFFRATLGTRARRACTSREPYRSADTGQLGRLELRRSCATTRGTAARDRALRAAARERPRDGHGRARGGSRARGRGRRSRRAGARSWTRLDGVLAGGPGPQAGVPASSTSAWADDGTISAGGQPSRLPRADRRAQGPRLGRRRGRPAAVAAGCGRDVARRARAAGGRRSRSPPSGLISLRERRRDETQALLAAEGGRAEAERRSRTDALTGPLQPPPRARLDRGRARPLRSHRRATERAACSISTTSGASTTSTATTSAIAC